MGEENKVLYGTVIWFSKGMGFIKQDDYEVDMFVHYSDITMEGYKTLSKGQLVSYQVGINRRGQPKAINVMVIK
jgi:CspA family cold shock protein